MILKTFKYRLYPTIEQAAKIDQTIGVCRLVYNLALEIKIKAYRDMGIKMSAYDLGYQISDLRDGFKWIAAVDRGALENSISSVDRAFHNFFEGKGFPKYKSKRTSRQSFRTHKNTRRIDWVKSTLTIPKIHNIPIVLSRKFEGKIKTISISRTPTKKYFASILVEVNQGIPILPPVKSAIGVDLGIATFATLSTGEKIANPKYLASNLARVKILQRRASKKKKGGSNQKKAYRRVAVLHDKITNRRNDFLHKISSGLISDNQTDTICLENLPVSNMMRNHKLSQAIGDVSWSEFVRQLEYKGNWYGKNIIKINRFYASSKTCSNCGHKKAELNLDEREWQCGNCNTTHDRDINAAINIRNSGMGSPVEPLESSAIAEAMKKERI